MKVCDLTIFYSETSGGVRNYLTEKQNFIRKHMPEVDHSIIVPGPEDSVVENGNTRIVRFKAPRQFVNKNYHMPLTPKPFYEVLKREKPDIIEVGSPFFSPWAAFKYREEQGTPVTGFFHSNIAETYITAFAPILQVFFRGLFYHAGWAWCRKVYNRCDVVLAPSRLMKERLEDNGIGNVVEQGFGVDTSVFHPDKRTTAFRASIGAAENDTVFLFVGRLHREKGLDIAVKSFLSMDQANSYLVIIGEGQARPYVESMAQRNRRIKYLGFMNNRQKLAEAYASSDVFVMPCANETFGMAYLEALASGIPIVAIRDSGIVNQIPDRYCLKSRASEIIPFAGNMERMKKASRSISRKEVHQYVVDSGYGWETSFHRLFDTYQGILDRS